LINYTTSYSKLTFTAIKTSDVFIYPVVMRMTAHVTGVCSLAIKQLSTVFTRPNFYMSAVFEFWLQ